MDLDALWKQANAIADQHLPLQGLQGMQYDVIQSRCTVAFNELLQFYLKWFPEEGATKKDF